MVVAGVLIETTPGAAPLVAGRLALAPGVTLQGGDGTRRIAAVLEAVDGAALEALTEQLLRDDERILGVFPTFVGDADEPA
ncbi:MAG TPA: hypothetical protein VF805_14880 [Anaeromyxobacteraceae bacterium]